MRGASPAFLLGVVVIAVLLAGSGTARADLVVGGKAVLPGAWAVPYGQGGSPAGKSVFGDGDLVYDTEIQVYVLYSGSAPVPLQVSLEQYDPGTITQYVNQTQGNATTLVPVELPARLNIQWSNQSTTLVPGQLTIVTVPVPAASSERHLQLTVGNAAWSLMHLTPTGSSLAGIYSAYGLDAALLLEAAVTAAVFLGFAAVARGLARRIHRPPKVPLWWPASWVGLPLLFFFADYVPTNQFLGSLTPFAYPFFLGVAAFPYLPRLWKEFEWAEFNGFRARSSTEAVIPKAVLPVVRTKEGLRCAPETWREAVYTLFGAPLPEVRMEVVRSDGMSLKLEPSGLPATCPLPPWYASDVDLVFWYDARRGLNRRRHRLRWFREETIGGAAKGPASDLRPPVRSKRRWDPHLEAGTLQGSFPPIREVAEFLAGVRSVEQEALDHEVDRLTIAELRGEQLRRAREASTELLEVALRAYWRTGHRLDREQLTELVRVYGRDREKGSGETGARDTSAA
ncbi:MAG: hypothetical protein L3K17_07335 [Thermoplasmata archaeon]|nr:hypothetical protein [Thermoplasmata archaeon]